MTVFWGAEPRGVAEVRRLGEYLARTKAASRRADAAGLRRRVDDIAFDIDGLYDKVKFVVSDLRDDGGYEKAIASLESSLWRLRQAEVLLERAKSEIA